MNSYETVFAVQPYLTEDKINELKAKLMTVIEKNNGTVHVEDSWGLIDMAYPVKKFNQANYTLWDYTGPTDLPALLERAFRLDPHFLRFLTVKLEDNVDSETAKAAAESRLETRKSYMN